MLELSTTTDQTIAVGGTLSFDRTIINNCCNCAHRNGAATIKMLNGGKHVISFSGNIGVPTDETPGEIQLQVSLSGTNMPESLMIATPAAANEFFNVSTRIAEKTCGCAKTFDTVNIVNTSTIPVIVRAGATIIIERDGD